MTKIHVRSNFAGSTKKVDSVSLGDDNSKLISCLTELENLMKIKIVNYDLGEIYPDIEVTLNGVESNFLPERLLTKLGEGDILGISFITMGGG
jgi:hypothetical protein